MDKITAIIAEYNPLHNGHIYHLQQARSLGNPVIVIMSGDFVQRGEPAIFDKYKRAECAVLAGADIVFELPAPFCFAPADKYVLGAYKLLQQINADITLSFGSEEGNIQSILNTAQILNDQPNEFTSILRHNIDNGLNFVKSQSIALNQYADRHNIDIVDISKPNNILAVEYAKANIGQNSKFTLHTIKRKGDYKASATLTANGDNEFLSASAIRQAIKANNEISTNIVPQQTLDLINCTPINADYCDSDIYLYSIITKSRQQIESIFDVSEGLQNRIFQQAKLSTNTSELIANLTNARYTQSRIKRILTNILLGVTKQDFETAIYQPPIFNLLAAKKGSANLLSLINGEVITSHAALQYKDLTSARLTSAAHEVFKIINKSSQKSTIWVD